MLCVLALSSCGDTLQVQPIAHQELEGLVVAPFPVYWLGDTFRGLSVSEVSHDPGEAYAVSYGNCVQGGQGYCVPPLRIVTSPDNSFLPGGQTSQHAISLRGVRALLAQSGRTVTLATGGVVVDIYADAHALAYAAAQNLASINADVAPLEGLPAPLPDNDFEASPLPSQVPNPLHPLSGGSAGR